MFGKLKPKVKPNPKVKPGTIRKSYFENGFSVVRAT